MCGGGNANSDEVWQEQIYQLRYSDIHNLQQNGLKGITSAV